MARSALSYAPLHATDEQRARAWWGAFFATFLTLLGQVAYLFIDWRVHPGNLVLPTLRAVHAVEAVGLLALLVARRRTASPRLSADVFISVTLPYLIIF